MKLAELKSSFKHTYGQQEEAIYFIPEDITSETAYTSIETNTNTILSSGIYLLLKINEELQINLWSLNEPEIVSIQIRDIPANKDNSWIQYPINILKQYITQGIDFNHGFDIFIWGTLSPNAVITSQQSLEMITAKAFNDQLNGFEL